MILEGKYGYMVAMRDGETTAVPLEEVAGKLEDGRSEMRIDQRSENNRYQFWR